MAGEGPWLDGLFLCGVECLFRFAIAFIVPMAYGVSACLISSFILTWLVIYTGS